MAIATATPGIVELPYPDLRPWGLFTQNATDVSRSAGFRFPLGVQFQPPDLGSFQSEAIASSLCDDDPQFSGPRDFTDIEEQGGFQIVDGLTCSTLWKTPEEIEANLAERWDHILSYALASQLWTGSPATEHNLPTDDTPLAASSTILLGISTLEQALAQNLRNSQGVIHMPPSFLTYAVTNGTVNLRGGKLYSPGGHLVIADAGYEGSIASSAPMYATGPIYYAVTERQSRNASGFEAIDFSRNVIEIISEAWALLLYDPNLVFSTQTTRA